MVAKLTADEIRELGGYSPIDEETGASSSATADALAALSPLVATKVLDRMSTEEIRGLIGLKGSPILPEEETP